MVETADISNLVWARILMVAPIWVAVEMATVVVLVANPMFPIAKYVGVSILRTSVLNFCRFVLLRHLRLILPGLLMTLTGLATFLRVIMIGRLTRVLRLTLTPE